MSFVFEALLLLILKVDNFKRVKRKCFLSFLVRFLKQTLAIVEDFLSSILVLKD